MREVRGTPVCVVGGAGFLGSHLVNHLIDDRDCKVVVLDNLCVGKTKHVHPEAVFIHHDITGSEEFVRQVLQEYEVEFVFNYAAWPYIPDSFERPLQVFSVNATGAIKVINAAQDAGCAGILQVSSAEIYGSCREGKLTERSEVAPHSTYGAAKAAVDYYCQSAWRERVTPVVALRQFNCVGERETHPYIIPEIVSQLHGYHDQTRPKIRLGNNSYRDFLYAGDAVRMAVELLEKGTFGEVYNLGSEYGLQMYELAETIGQVMGYRSVLIEEEAARKRPWEIWHLQSDNSKLYSTILSRPRVSLTDALHRTVQYFRDNGNRWDW